MAHKTWQTVKIYYCQRITKEVELEAEVIYPCDLLPDQPPRMLAHRCSGALVCNLENKASCHWSGTNPGFDPFLI